MIPSDHLESDLGDSLARIAATPLAEVLLQQGILRRLAEEHLRRRLRDQVMFSSEEEPLVISRLWQGIDLPPPLSLREGWIEALPEMLRGPVCERWDQIRLQKWMEVAYRERLDGYFLERRADLEQVVYGMIRLRQQGVAEELYLRLLDDQADFGELARQYSLGEERFTRGLVGPMRISQPHPSIRAVLQQLSVGDLHPPFQVDSWILLVRMEHRQPAQLNDSTSLQLCQELLQQDIDATLDARLQALYPALLAAYPSPMSVAATTQPLALSELAVAADDPYGAAAVLPAIASPQRAAAVIPGQAAAIAGPVTPAAPAPDPSTELTPEASVRSVTSGSAEAIADVGPRDAVPAATAEPREPVAPSGAASPAPMSPSHPAAATPGAASCSPFIPLPIQSEGEPPSPQSSAAAAVRPDAAASEDSRSQSSPASTLSSSSAAAMPLPSLDQASPRRVAEAESTDPGISAPMVTEHRPVPSEAAGDSQAPAGS